MTAEGFDYKTFVENLTQQAQEIVPQDFNENQKKYVVNTLFNFANVAGQALAEDPSLNFTADQATMITQIIAEWSFHKSVDLIRSGIPQQYWDPVMQKIAYVIFEIAKQAFTQNMPTDQILDVIQHHVDKTYHECIDELKQKNLISDDLAEVAGKQSNIDKMMQEAAEQQALAEANTQGQDQASTQAQVQTADGSNQIQNTAQTASNIPKVKTLKDYISGEKGKVFKLATLAMLFNRMTQDKVQTMLDKFDTQDADSVVKFMKVPELEDKMNPNIAMECLRQIQMNLLIEY